MSIYLRGTFIGLIVTMLVGAPLWYKLQSNKTLRNFRTVREGKVYRSGQLSLKEYERVVRERGIKTIVCLRDNDTQVSLNEENWAKSSGLNFFRIPPRAWADAGNGVPAEIGLRDFRKVMDNPANYPVLIHCFAGYHRTGAFCSIYRMDYEGWSNQQAMKEMKVLGYDLLEEHEDILKYLTNYCPPTKVSPRPVQARSVARQSAP